MSAFTLCSAMGRDFGVRGYQVRSDGPRLALGRTKLEPVPIEQSHAELGWDRREYDLKPRKMARWH